MSIIHKKINTKYEIDEMKSIINSNILPNAAVKAVVNDYTWDNNTLKINSKLGMGTIKLFPKLVEIILELNVFGKMAGRTLEDTLDKEFKQLTD